MLQVSKEMKYGYVSKGAPEIMMIIRVDCVISSRHDIC